MGTVAILHPLALMLFVIVCVWFIRISRLSFVQFQLDVALKQSTSLEISFDFNQKLAIYLSFYKLLVKFIVYLNYSFDRKKIDKKRSLKWNWKRKQNDLWFLSAAATPNKVCAPQFCEHIENYEIEVLVVVSHRMRKRPRAKYHYAL